MLYTQSSVKVIGTKGKFCSASNLPSLNFATALVVA